MSRIKELREDPNNNINFVDTILFFFPDLKSKYIDLFIRILKKNEEISESYIEFYASNFPHLTKDSFKGMNLNRLLIEGSILSAIAESDRWPILSGFCEYNEKGLITDNDLSKIKTIDEMSRLVSIAEMKLIDKEMESQVIKIYEDDTWLFLKPLTPTASSKYGANTKWCTTSVDRDYFWNYTKRGVLVYCINKKTGLKVGVFKDFEDGNLSFWNDEDKRVDSYYSGLPYEFINLIIKNIEGNLVTNYSLLSNEMKIELETRRNGRKRPTFSGNLDDGDRPEPMVEQPLYNDIIEPRVGRVRRPIGEDNGMLRGLIPPPDDQEASMGFEMDEEDQPGSEMEEKLDYMVHDMTQTAMAREGRNING